MSTIVSFNGSSYTIPANGDSNWGSNVSSYLIAISTGTLQRSGGSFTLTSEINFGANFGIKAVSYKSYATNPSSAGILKLGNNESIGWRNAGNTGDYILKVNASDVLQYDSKTFLFSGEIVNADISASAAIALSKLAALSNHDRVLVSSSTGVISESSTTATTLSYLDVSSSLTTLLSGKENTFSVLSIAKGGTNSSTALSNNKVMISSAGAISESSVTTTTLGYLDATSSIQTQLDGKQASGSYALTTSGLNQFASTTSSQLAGVISDETGTGSLVFSNTPSFTTPSLGVATATSINSTTIPSSKTLVVTTDKLSVLAATSSSELAGVISDETGSGSLVFANTPTLVTPVIGAATGTSLALGSTLNSSAIVDLTSTSLGFLEPRMTLTQRDAISSPATGLQIYNTTSNKLNYYNGSAWKEAGGVGTWAASTAYAVGDLVLYGQQIYSCLTAHTSSTFLETDMAGTSPKWRIVNTQSTTQNLMTFGMDFEDNDIGGWTACGCATVTNGLLASVGSGGAIFSSTNGGRTKGANTTSPAVVSSGQLDGSYSLNFATSGAGTIGDMYISSAYKIPIAFQSTVLQVKFKYKVVSGTPVMAGTSSNTYACAIYDVDNNTWMPLVGAFNFVQSSGVGTFTGTTQVPYNSTQFQIAIYNPIAPTGASSLYVDDFYVGPQGIDSSSSVVATNVYRASTQSLTNATAQKVQFATKNFDNGNCYDNATNYRYTAKTPGVYLINTQVVFAGNASNIRITMIYKNGSEIFRTHSNTNILAQSTYLPATYSVNLAAGDYIEVYAYQDTGGALNIGGSNTTYLSVQLVSSPSGLINSGVIAARFYRNTTQTGVNTNASSVKVNLDTIQNDPTGAVNIGSSRFEVKTTGWYEITGSVAVSSTNVVAGAYYQAAIAVDGSLVTYGPTLYVAASKGFRGTVYYKNYFTAGQYIELYFYGDANNSVNTLTISAGVGTTYLEVSRLSGPAVIAATETVAAFYNTGAAQSIPNGAAYTVVNYGTKVFDSHNAVTTGASWKFTAPVSGIYAINASILYATYAASAVGNTSRLVVLNSSGSEVFRISTFIAQTTTAILPYLNGTSYLVKLLANDWIQIGTNHSESTAKTLTASDFQNTFSVVRVGNYV